MASFKDLKQRTDAVSEKMVRMRDEYGFSIPYERTLSVEYVAGVNHLAAEAAKSRDMFFEPEQQIIRDGMLDDIAFLDKKLGGAESSGLPNPVDRVQALVDALAEVAANRDRALQTMKDTREIVVRNRKNIYTDIQTIRTLLAAAENEHLLVHRSERVPDADIARLHKAQWDVLELHGAMERAYERSSRTVLALRFLLGR